MIHFRTLLIFQIFQNMYRVDLIHILRSGVVSYFSTTYTCLVFQLCHHNKHLMGHFEFLHGSRLICLPLNFLENMHWQHLFEKLDESETIIAFISVNTTTPGFSFFGHQSCTWPQSGPFCWQDSTTIVKVSLLFLLHVRHSKWPCSFFWSCLCPKIVHMRNLVFWSHLLLKCC